MFRMPETKKIAGQQLIKMTFTETHIAGAFVIHLSPYIDERGAFSRLFCEEELRQAGFNKKIVQINHSYNKEKGTLRGMHFQYPPFAETKIIRCVRGKVFDVLIDIRKKSPTFLQHFTIELSANVYNAICIPEGCAHGFQTLESDCELLYLHTNFYNKPSEGGIRFDDTAINIQWPLDPKNITLKDSNYPLLDFSFTGIDLNFTTN